MHRRSNLPLPGASPRGTVPRGQALRRAAPVVALTAVLVALLGSPASAHTALTSSDPAAGATLDAAPGAISLTFSGTVRGDGSSISVTGDGGAPAAVGALSAVDKTVTVPVSGLTGGGYQVVWTVVSADGHAINGQFPFTVAAPSPSPTSASPLAGPAQAAGSSSPAAPAAASPTPTVRIEPSAPPSSSDSNAVWWIIAVISVAVLLLAAVAAVQLIRRRGTAR
ncbi:MULTISPECIES: copper resistance CopC family protein [Parafrankia]|uniref:copper resistance CopC family protein n=1 Tax=Parafrankia TaxID=2994362 RepID=UPI0013F4E663|nr:MULTISPECIES: copper resistance CopC family protein [Parafrankia]MBE3200870.1 copper resistance protein CopC [Parafrankia sp. CH37]